MSGFSRTGAGPPDQPPPKLRRSAEALAKAEGGHDVRLEDGRRENDHALGPIVVSAEFPTIARWQLPS